MAEESHRKVILQGRSAAKRTLVKSHAGGRLTADKKTNTLDLPQGKSSLFEIFLSARNVD